MKFRILIAFALVSFLFSCSSEDSGNSSGPTSYFSLESGNFWKYNVSIDDTESGQDHLFVGNDTLVSYKNMKTMAQPIGFFSNSLRHNALKNVSGSLKITGKLGLNLGDAFPVEIPLEDFVIFKEDAVNNEELSSVDGVIEQTVGTFPLKINYIVTATSLESLATFTTPAPDNKTYTNLKKVRTVMNMEVTSRQEVAPGIFFDIPVMNAQDVVVSTQYYSKNVGMVYANTEINYNLAIAIPEGPPQEGTQNQDEFLDTYEVN